MDQIGGVVWAERRASEGFLNQAFKLVSQAGGQQVFFVMLDEPRLSWETLRD